MCYLSTKKNLPSIRKEILQLLDLALLITVTEETCIHLTCNYNQQKPLHLRRLKVHWNHKIQPSICSVDQKDTTTTFYLYR